eukprot:1265512-Prorocentrum_lima.AAC.1
MAGGQRNPFNARKKLLAEVSGRARDDLIKEMEASREEYVAVCEAAKSLTEKGALEEFTYGKRRDLAQLVESLER